MAETWSTVWCSGGFAESKSLSPYRTDLYLKKNLCESISTRKFSKHHRDAFRAPPSLHPCQLEKQNFAARVLTHWTLCNSAKILTLGAVSHCKAQNAAWKPSAHVGLPAQRPNPVEYLCAQLKQGKVAAAWG